MPGISIAIGCAVLVTAIAAVTDWRTGLIPNWLTLPPILIAPLLHGMFGGAYALVDSVAGVVTCALVPFLIFKMKGMAGGDVKLFTAIGAIVGFSLGIQAELIAVVLAALFALGRLAWNGRLLGTLKNTFFLPLNPILPEKWRRELTPELMSEIRLGPAIFAGTLATAGMHVWGIR